MKRKRASLSFTLTSITFLFIQLNTRSLFHASLFLSTYSSYNKTWSPKAVGKRKKEMKQMECVFISLLSSFVTTFLHYIERNEVNIWLTLRSFRFTFFTMQGNGSVKKGKRNKPNENGTKLFSVGFLGCVCLIGSFRAYIPFHCKRTINKTTSPVNNRKPLNRWKRI